MTHRNKEFDINDDNDGEGDGDEDDDEDDNVIQNDLKLSLISLTCVCLFPIITNNVSTKHEFKSM